MSASTVFAPSVNESAYVRYVFLDVVKFTSNRSVEVQCDVVNTLNELIRTILNELNLEEAQRVLIPTGDGVAIALFNIAYDSHLRLALELLSRVHLHNQQTSDAMRQFRFGSA